MCSVDLFFPGSDFAQALLKGQTIELSHGKADKDFQAIVQLPINVGKSDFTFGFVTFAAAGSVNPQCAVSG